MKQGTDHLIFSRVSVEGRGGGGQVGLAEVVRLGQYVSLMTTHLHSATPAQTEIREGHKRCFTIAAEHAMRLQSYTTCIDC